MKRNSNALAPNEAKFAERKHSILEEYMEKYELSYDEYYDAIAIGYIEGIKRYCRNSSDGRDLEEVLYSFMNKAHMKHIRNKFNKQETPDIYSFNYKPEEGRSYEEIIADTKTNINVAIDGISLKQTIESFNETQKQIIQLLFEGHSYSFVAKELNISSTVFFKHLNDIRNILASDMMPFAA